jgi:hypothetical protein
MSICECGLKRLDTVGPDRARVLVIGGWTGEDDMKNNMPFSDKRGAVLEGEMARVGLPMQTLRLTYVDLHPPTSTCPGNFVEALKEMKDRDGVLLLGADVAERFQLGSVSEQIGLCVSSPYFPHSTKFVMLTTQPPTGDFIGEFRLSIEKFARKLKEVKNG